MIRRTSASWYARFALVGALVMWMSAACGPEERPGRVLLVGIDGASMRVIGPMMQRGALPNLASIARAGVHGSLRSQFPIDSPPIWNTIATGVVPKKHGIPSFSHKNAEGQQQLFLSTDRKVPAIWNIVSEAGFTTGVVNFWNTYPPDRINGVMISDHVLAREVDGRVKMTHSGNPPGGTVVYPESWAERIDTILDSRETLTDVPNMFRDEQGFAKWVLKKDLIRRYEEDGALARFALAIEAEIHPDLLMVLLPGVDRVSHHLWGNLEPAEKYGPNLRPTDAERKVGANALRSYYRYTDEIVGLLTKDYGPEDLVLVVSDHGFEAGTAMLYLSGRHETEEAVDGILFARGPGVGPPGGDVTDVSVRDVTPTILAWFGIPIGDDMDGRPMPFLKPARPPTRIESHRDTPIEKVTTEPSGVEDEIVERLKMIGYIE